MNKSQFQFESMGTHWEVATWENVSSNAFRELEQKSFLLADEFDKTYSRFKEASFVQKIATLTGTIEVPEDFVLMLEYYKRAYNPSNHQLNPLIGHTLSDLGYDADYSLQAKKDIREVPSLDIVKIINRKTISVSEPVLFDFGAIGKGFFVDKLFSHLKEKGLNTLLVNGSGDIRYDGPPARFGLEDPHNAKNAIGVLEMSKGAFAASGINRRAWREHHHIVDTKTGKSSTNAIASWIHAKSAAIADLIATSLLLSEPEALQEMFNFSYCVMQANGSIKRSQDFSAELFVK